MKHEMDDPQFEKILTVTECYLILICDELNQEIQSVTVQNYADVVIATH